MVGAERIGQHDTISQNGQVLHVLNPTDSVRDRLASFFWYKDYTALAAAIAVCLRQDVDLGLIAEWSRREGENERFEEFSRRLRARQERP